jgi:hypothetical protein
MNAFARILIVVASGCALNAHAACELPLPSAVRVLPDGATATQDAMSTARTDISAYIAAAEAYVACIDEELAAAGEGAPPEFKSILVNRRNAAAAERDIAAAAFNRQLQAYRAAHPDAPSLSQPSSTAAAAAGSAAPPQ